MPDVGWEALDVVIALAFVYFLLSLVASGFTEAVSWVMQKRAKDLEEGLRTLLADPSKTDEVLDHPLIKQLARTGRRKRTVPSYLSPRTFSLAFLDTLVPPEPGQAGSRDVLAGVQQSVNTLPSDLKRQLQPILDQAGASVAELRVGVENWFNDAMDRVSGWYRRWSQLWICVFALAVTLGFNVDTVRVADRLWNDDTLRQSAVAAAVDQVSTDAGGTGAGGGTTGTQDTASDPVDKAVSQTKETTQKFHELALPVGWGDANDTVRLSTFAGWLITFLAVSLGAPFWFDTLSRLARVRAAGPKPSKTDTTDQ